MLTLGVMLLLEAPRNSRAPVAGLLVFMVLVGLVGEIRRRIKSDLSMRRNSGYDKS